MLEKLISTEMIKLCINNFNSNAMTPEEEARDYFTGKKLKNLKSWDKLKCRETKQIDQFMM